MTTNTLTTTLTQLDAWGHETSHTWMRPIQIRLPEAMITELDATAAAEDVTRAQWIRQAVAARLAAAHRRD